MNREKLERCRKIVTSQSMSTGAVLGDLAFLLDALLEESPDVGRVALVAEVTALDVDQRLTQLEAKTRELAPRWRDGVESRLQGFARRIEGLEQGAWDRSTELAKRVGAIEAPKPPDVGAPWGIDTRLTALEEWQRVLGQAQEANRRDIVGLQEAVDALDGLRRRRVERLQAMRGREQMVGHRPLVLELLDALLGPPDVGHGDPQRHEWVAEAEVSLTPPKRGATPCAVCLSNICRGDVDARGCDTRAATRKAITP